MNNQSLYIHLRNVALILVSSLFLYNSTYAQEKIRHSHQKHLKKMHHGVTHSRHGMIFKGSEKFPTTRYNETKNPRPVERPPVPKITGDAKNGKILAYANHKGRCLVCHILGPEGDQAGDMGPNLSAYARSGRDSAYIFQHIWDARAHNPSTIMPPFGTHNILTKHEVLDIMAYLKSLNSPVDVINRPKPQVRNFNIAGEDFTLADLYIEQGKTLFHAPATNGKSCASCHSTIDQKNPDLKGIAATYPKYDPGLKRIIGLEQRINVCQKKFKRSNPYPLGSKESNVVTSYVKFLSRRMPIKIANDGPAATALERGRTSFFKKAGQLNFSCADCHTSSSGKWLRGQQLSAIKPGGKHSKTAATWPRHFIAIHDLGLISLRQRIRHCQVVTHTFPLKLHSQEYTDLELYITSLANGKPMLAPTKSRLRGGD